MCIKIQGIVQSFFGLFVLEFLQNEQLEGIMLVQSKLLILLVMVLTFSILALFAIAIINCSAGHQWPPPTYTKQNALNQPTTYSRPIINTPVNSVNVQAQARPLISTPINSASIQAQARPLISTPVNSASIQAQARPLISTPINNPAHTQTQAQSRLFFPPYKFPFWGLPYGVKSKAGFFNPGLFPFVPGGPAFPPFDGVFGGPPGTEPKNQTSPTGQHLDGVFGGLNGPGKFPGSGPAPFQWSLKDQQKNISPPYNGENYLDHGEDDTYYDDLDTEMELEGTIRRKRMPNRRPPCCRRKRCRCRRPAQSDHEHYEDYHPHYMESDEQGDNYPKYMRSKYRPKPPKKNRNRPYSDRSPYGPSTTTPYPEEEMNYGNEEYEESNPRMKNQHQYYSNDLPTYTTSPTTTTSTTPKPPCYAYTATMILVPVPCPELNMMSFIPPAYPSPPTTTPEPSTTPPSTTTTTTTPVPTTTSPTPTTQASYIALPSMETYHYAKPPQPIVILPVQHQPVYYPATTNEYVVQNEYEIPYHEDPYAAYSIHKRWEKNLPIYNSRTTTEKPYKFVSSNGWRGITRRNNNKQQTYYQPETEYNFMTQPEMNSFQQYNTGSSFVDTFPLHYYDHEYEPKVRKPYLNSGYQYQTEVNHPNSKYSQKYQTNHYENEQYSGQTEPNPYHIEPETPPIFTGPMSIHTSPITRRSADPQNHYSGGTHLSGPLSIYFGSHASVFLANSMQIATNRSESSGEGGLVSGTSDTNPMMDMGNHALDSPATPTNPSPTPAAISEAPSSAKPPEQSTTANESPSTSMPSTEAVPTSASTSAPITQAPPTAPTMMPPAATTTASLRLEDPSYNSSRTQRSPDNARYMHDLILLPPSALNENRKTMDNFVASESQRFDRYIMPATNNKINKNAHQYRY